MKYQNLRPEVDQNLRKTVNLKILQQIFNGGDQITKEQILNSYTGKGGLHELDFDDFECFSDYTNAKKDIELGQFFTPFELAEKICDLIKPEGSVIDPCCGAGVFANFVNEVDFTGVDIDAYNVSVAKYLYPQSKIHHWDVQYWKTEKRFDYVITNPPFNLKWGLVSSQSFIIRCAKEWLKPHGLFAAVVPASYLDDEMIYTRDIEYINKNYHWIGQLDLGSRAFKRVYGVIYPMKVIIFQNRPGDRFKSSFDCPSAIEERVLDAKRDIRENKLKVVQELAASNKYSFSDGRRDVSGGFEFQIKKILFELRTHKELRKNYNKALELLSELENQKMPEDMDWKEWDKVRLTKPKVLKRLNKMRKPKRKRFSKDRQRRHVEEPDCIQLMPFDEITVPADISEFLDGFTFKDKKGEHHLTDIQKFDIGRMLVKRYGVLNWEQGTGKTVAQYAISVYRKTKVTIIVAPALAIHRTYVPFMKSNGESFQVINRPSDLVEGVNYWLVPMSNLGGGNGASREEMNNYSALKRILMLRRLADQIKEKIRQMGCDVQLIVDESDELSNTESQRYRAARKAFIECNYKLLATGTTTRNNASEYYSQLELLFNNSKNMIDHCDFVYRQERNKTTGEMYIREIANSNKGEPFPAHRGLSQWKRCFTPGKSTVFGIQKHNQDIYNHDELMHILARTQIVRTFKEVAGDKYEVKHMRVTGSMPEIMLYEKIMKEFYSIYSKYFKNTGNVRKEAYMKLIRQIQLLIKACSIPENFEEYDGGMSTKRKSICEKITRIDEKVIIGCTTKEAAKLYMRTFGHLMRPMFYIDGGTSFTKRGTLIGQFESTQNGILICTQQALKSSVNIPSCDHVIIESLQWNMPKMSQFYFRAIRFNSENKTFVHFVTYADTIEDNLLGLLMAKQRVNQALKFDDKPTEDIFNEHGFDIMALASMLVKKYDEESETMVLEWGSQKLI